MSAAATRAQELRAQVSGVAHESFDGALVVKTLGREDRRRTGSPPARELRDANIRVGRMRPRSTRCWRRCPTSACSSCCSSGMQPGLQRGAISAGDLVQIAYLFTLLSLPIRAIGWLLGDMPRSVVGGERVESRARRHGGTDYGGSRLHGEAAGGKRPQDRALLRRSADLGR